uniref:Ig-like domain-containing protein n=1 Tax=Photinus pyralis TaxID=7054 RepID=A0A1Y1KCQ0_PHOPY
MDLITYIVLTVTLASSSGINPNEDRQVGVTTHPTWESPYNDQNGQDDDDTHDIVDKATDGLPEERPPQFTNPKKMYPTQVKPAGNMISLKCKATGYPVPTITWKINDKEPKRHLGSIKYGPWSLTLEDLVTGDTGTYTCNVCNKLGCISHNYTVEVIERYPSKPYIKDGYPQNATVLVQNNATLECPQLIADLEPYLQWIRPSSFPPEFINNETVNGTVLQVPS